MFIKNEGYLSIILLIKFAHILSDMFNSSSGKGNGKKLFGVTCTTAVLTTIKNFKRINLFFANNSGIVRKFEAYQYLILMTG